MLKVKIIQANKMLDKYIEAQQGQQQYKQVKDIYNSLHDKKGEFQTIVSSFKKLKSMYPGVTGFPNPDVATKMAKDVSKGTLPSLLDVNNLVGQVNKWKETLQDDWKKHVTASTNELKDTLGALRPLVDQEDAINNVIGKINKLPNLWPIDDAAITKLNNYILEGQQVIDNIGASPEVQVFIKKVSSGTATLADLNNEVEQWMRAKKLDVKLKISF